MSSKTRWAIIVAIIAVVLAALYIQSRPVTPQPESTIAVSEPVLPAADETPPPVPETVTADEPSTPAPVHNAAPAANAPPEVHEPVELQVVFSGRVTDLHGKPIMGAHVVLLPARMQFSTDGDGIYKAMLPKGSIFGRDGLHLHTDVPFTTTYELVASHSDYSDSDRVEVPSTQIQINFTLRPLGIIEGRVVAARTGQPVTDFRIRPELEHDPAPTTAEADFKRVRDDQGRFRLDRIKAGLSTISVGAKGFADTTVTFPPVVPGETRERVEVRLEPGAVLQGQVVDTNGRSIRLAQVSGGYPRRGAVSDSDGKFRLDSLPAGAFDLTVKHENYAPKTVNVVLGNASVNNTRIVLTAGAVIEGEFTVGGKPTPGVVNIFLPADSPIEITLPPGMFLGDNHLFARVGEDGRYRHPRVPEGRVRVEGVVDMQQNACTCTWRKIIEVVVAADSTHTVDFNFPASEAVVGGTVYADAKTPYTGTGTVTVSYADFSLEGETTFRVIGNTSGGHYSLCLPSGAAVLNLVAMRENHTGGPQMMAYSADIKPGDKIAHDFLLYHGATLRISSDSLVDMKTVFVQTLYGEVSLPEILTKEFIQTVRPVTRGVSHSAHTTVIPGLEPGSYTVFAFRYNTPDESATVLASKVVRLAEGQTIEVALPVKENTTPPN